MNPIYRYCWKQPAYYGRQCQLIERVGMNRSRVKFLDDGEVAIVYQMALRILKSPKRDENG